MQIGTRWPVGDVAPDSLSGVLRTAIGDEERTLSELGADTSLWHWTLTWLEGEPVVELDDGTRIVERHGEAIVTRED